MKLTAAGHACVRLTEDSVSVVIDPGNFTDVPRVVAGAAAVLVTHVHRDHVDAGPLAEALRENAETSVYADADSCAAVVAAGVAAERLHTVEPGDTFAVGPFTVTVGGGWHAVVHPLLPRAVNVTYLVEADHATVFHPGDSFDLPGRRVDVGLVPESGPWLKLGEVIDFARACDAVTLVPIHGGLNSAAANAMVDARLADPALVPDKTWVRLGVGESMTV